MEKKENLKKEIKIVEKAIENFLKQAFESTEEKDFIFLNV